MQDLDEVHPMDLEDKADDIDYSIEDIHELNYLDPLYGSSSRMSYQEWISQSESTKAISKIWYEPENLRQLVFFRAGIKSSDADAAAFKKLAEQANVNLTDESQQ